MLFILESMCNMENRMLGRSGVLVSPLCLGAMNFGGSTNENVDMRSRERIITAIVAKHLEHLGF
jgi:aryl-alcohol dehydrogenase-like predicted oxidoreductase